MKRYAIVEEDKVVNITKSVEVLGDNWIESNDAKIGYVYDGITFSPPEKELNVAKKEKIEELKGRCDQDMNANIEHDSITWEGNAEAQRLMAAVLSPGDDGELLHWRNATGSSHEMLSYTDIQAIARKIRKRGFECDSKLQDKLSLVNNATTVSEVESISWEA